jgi:membrane-associated protease RseP (regulator of RpoE activity)
MRWVLVVLVAALLATPAAGQGGPAWLGLTYDLRWVQVGSGCQAEAVVEEVVRGSPAERAGLRTGDTLVAIDGDVSAPARLHLLGPRLVPGDTVRLLVHRQGATHRLVAVAERRPGPPGAISLQAPAVAPGPAPGPLVTIRGDSLVVTRLETAGPFPGGFWVTRPDGQSVFRSLRGGPATELDRRVASLVACATESRALTHLAGPDLQRLYEQAESLRVVLARRALEGGQAERRVFAGALLHPGAAGAGTARPDGPPTRPDETFLAAALRGVAGAEVTAMEPELAAYFQGARGLLVLRVAPGSAAERGGIRPGDVIASAAGQAVTTVGELRSVLAQPGAAALELAVVRQGRRLALTLPRP